MLDLEAVAARNNARIVALGHGSMEDAARFHKHFPVKHMYVSEDFAAFQALSLHQGTFLDFLGPSALLSAVPTAMRSLTRPGTIAAKIEQPLPGQGDFRQMGGQLYFGPGNTCHFAHVEHTPGSHLGRNEIIESTGWTDS
eukprot:TRINITY_DN49267_c0_g1_i1.p1 TRINITY_DN49267_c0_g1~~TRINITY_DN49267_c0_g1_i1.p1  ORF type:complete len:140 (+),score=16.12 TRINITY_DN49267_c0_g1_i1:290-709(+)